MNETIPARPERVALHHRSRPGVSLAFRRGIASMAALMALAGAGDMASAHSRVPVDLPNFHVVHPFLLRGGAPTATGLRQLARRGVKTVIDLRAAPRQLALERREATAAGLRYVNLPMSSAAPTPKEVQTFLRLVDNPRTRPVFVHCAHGSDRTGCLVGVYRVTHDGWTYARALQEMRRYWFNPHYVHLSGTVRKFAKR